MIAAGFLLAGAEATYAKQFPNVDFAITDYTVHKAPFVDKKGKSSTTNVEGLTYAANESGCLVGVLAAKMAQRMGGRHDRRRRRHQDPAGRHLDRGLQVLRAEGRAGHEGPRPGTRRTSSRPTSARRSPQNQISQGAQVLFQVAGGCGLGTLKAADEAGIWGIGVDVDQYTLAKRVLTSGVKRVDNGVYRASSRSRPASSRAAPTSSST